LIESLKKETGETRNTNNSLEEVVKMMKEEEGEQWAREINRLILSSREEVVQF